MMQSRVEPRVWTVASRVQDLYRPAIAGAVAAVETAVDINRAVAVCVETSSPSHRRQIRISKEMQGETKSFIAAVG